MVDVNLMVLAGAEQGVEYSSELAQDELSPETMRVTVKWSTMKPLKPMALSPTKPTKQHPLSLPPGNAQHAQSRTRM